MITIEGKPESGGTLGKFTCKRCNKNTWATATDGELNYCPNCGSRLKIDLARPDSITVEVIMKGAKDE